MNFNFYIFGTPKGRYNQYPDDYIATTLTHLQEDTEGARLAIHRELNLTHYVYTERIDESIVIGFCLIFNNAHILKPKQLITFFRHIIEKRLVESGKIIKYDNKGKLQYAVDSFSECVKEIEKLRELINDELENNGSKYNIETLSSIYNGTKTMDTIDISASDAQIVLLTERHNTVIVNSSEGIEHDIPQVIEFLREQNQVSFQIIEQLKDENKSLVRKKKQYRYIILLSLLILCCVVGLYIFYNDVNNKAARIADLGKTIREKNATIIKRDSTILRIQSSLDDLQNDINSIVSYSGSTGATIRNNDNYDNGWILWLNAKRKLRIESFYIKGQSSGSVDIGMFDTDDNLVASYEANASSGEFRKVNVGSEWTIDSGTYYMKIRSGVSLQYHSSSDKEYSQFAGGALEVTGASGYSDRNEISKRTNHGYYQYFYNIKYHIVTN